MSGNTFGKIFAVTNWGESHGKALGSVIDGCPPGIELSEKDIQVELDRRKPGQSKVSTARNESDNVEILSGVFEGKTTGTPISIIIRNKDQKSKDYSEISKIYRPGHADYTYQMKYGIRDYKGGGRSSARTTVGTVAAGAIAKKVLKEKAGIEIISYVEQIKDIVAEIDFNVVTPADVEKNIVRCPDEKTAKKMENLITETQKQGDSVGGTVVCVIKNVPVGLGEPVFDKLSSDLARAMININAAKGFELGRGFKVATLYGSEMNDCFFLEDDKISTESNNSGGMLGGISNGMNIHFRVPFKPTPTIHKEMKTINIKGEEIKFTAKGRHDPCVIPRAVPIVDAFAAIVTLDHYLRYLIYKR